MHRVVNKLTPTVSRSYQASLAFRSCAVIGTGISSYRTFSSRGTNQDEEAINRSTGSTIIQGPSLLTSTGVHRPSPSLFYLPGLRSIPFWTRDEQVAYNDPIVKQILSHVEGHTETIKKEYQAAVMGVNRRDENAALDVDYDLAKSGGEHADGALHEGQWDWHSFILKGVKQPKFTEVCPKTVQCLNEIEDLLFSTTPFSFAFFSTLQPGASIKPHRGPMNLRLRVHLPLIVPSNGDCGIFCGGQKRKWDSGKALVIDDSYVHEVWNHSSEPRVVFVFDIWHPDVKNIEKENINEMFKFAKSEGWL